MQRNLSAIHIVSKKIFEEVELGKSGSEILFEQKASALGFVVQHHRITEAASHRPRFVTKTLETCLEKQISTGAELYLSAENIEFLTKRVSPLIAESLKNIFILKSFSEIDEEYGRFISKLSS